MSGRVSRSHGGRGVCVSRSHGGGWKRFWMCSTEVDIVHKFGESDRLLFYFACTLSTEDQITHDPVHNFDQVM